MRESDHEQSRQYDLALSHIDVDLNELADFRTALQHELDHNLRPAAAAIIKDHEVGVAFGARIAGAGVQTARTKYHEALIASIQSLEYYVRMSEVLISAIHTLTTNYRTSDLSAMDVLKAIQTAHAAVPTAASALAAPHYSSPSLAKLGLPL